MITRHDKSVAKPVPEPRHDRSTVREAVAALRKLNQRIEKRTKAEPKLSFDDFKSARDVGRK